jgi:tRNA A37 N6-isopentenylltransferase MiaA
MSPYEGLSDGDLHGILEELDPYRSEQKISANNRRRVSATSRFASPRGSKTAFLAKQNHQPIYPVVSLNSTRNGRRSTPTLEKGWRRCFALGPPRRNVPLIEKYGRNAMAFKAIGVKELFPYLDKQASLERRKPSSKRTRAITSRTSTPGSATNSR